MNSNSFYEAARRHHTDGLTLAGLGRPHNAGHLLGLAAECGLKAFLPMAPAGNKPVAPFAEHIDKLIPLINRFTIELHGRNLGRYAAMIPNIAHFTDWRIEHRYYEDAAIPASLPQWQMAATEVAVMLDQALIAGDMP